jgi:hypothetical protein
VILRIKGLLDKGLLQLLHLLPVPDQDEVIAFFDLVLLEVGSSLLDESPQQRWVLLVVLGNLDF